MNSKNKKRKPVHPGMILNEHYIIPLNLNLTDLANLLHTSRNSLYKVRKGIARITPDLAMRLAKAFNTSPDLWLNLQQKFDLWELSKQNFILKIPQIYPRRTQKAA